MDPDSSWQSLLDALRNQDWESAREVAQDLLDWLTIGGFPPKSVMAQDQDFLRTLAIAGCEYVLFRTQGSSSDHNR